MIVQVGQIWKANPPGRERLRVARLWQGYVHDEPELWTLRAEPLTGGRPLVTSPEHLIENYRLEAA